MLYLGLLLPSTLGVGRGSVNTPYLRARPSLLLITLQAGPGLSCSRAAVLRPFCVHDYIVLLLSVRAVRLDPAGLYGVSLPLGAEAKLHHGYTTSKLPPTTAPTRAGVRYGAPALRIAPVQTP